MKRYRIRKGSIAEKAITAAGILAMLAMWAMCLGLVG